MQEVSTRQLTTMMKMAPKHQRMKVVQRENLMTQLCVRKYLVDLKERKNLEIMSLKTPLFALDVRLTRKNEVVLIHTLKNFIGMSSSTCVKSVIMDLLHWMASTNTSCNMIRRQRRLNVM